MNETPLNKNDFLNQLRTALASRNFNLTYHIQDLRPCLKIEAPFSCLVYVDNEQLSINLLEPHVMKTLGPIDMCAPDSAVGLLLKFLADYSLVSET